MQEKHFPRKSWIWEPDFRGCEEGLKNSSVPGQTLACRQVRKEASSQQLCAGFSVNEVCKAVLFMSWGRRPQLYWCTCIIMVCLFWEVWMHVWFYFLAMAATAFLAASSRSLAEVMGSPLSDRIRFASLTLVPEHGHIRIAKTLW